MEPRPLGQVLLLGTTAGVPDASQILTSSLVSIPFATRVGGFRANNLLASSVSVGQVLAIALVIHYANGGGIGDWTQTATRIAAARINIPDGANGFAANLFVNEFGPFGIDAGFRTYVDAGVATTPVPEPATLFLLGLGLAGAKMRLRLRKKLRELT